MNDNRPDDVLKRAAAERLAELLRIMPVVVITGARQTGKTTLVRAFESGGRSYLSLDDVELRSVALENPADLVGRAQRVTLDEVQRAPDLLLEIKRAVDAGPRQAGRFVLTGSANLLLMERVSESLAGRAAYLTLWPLTRRELLGAASTGLWTELFDTRVAEWPDLVRASDAPRADWRTLARQGGFPVPALHLGSDAERRVWFQAYVQTYLERDLQTLSTIDALPDFRRLMRAAALRTGQVINQAEIARDIAISRPTAHRYLNLLETSYQIMRIEPYSVNRTRRLIKSPKLYWNDSGMALAVSGTAEPTGAHLENLIACDLVAWRDLHIDRPAVLYWRTVEGKEVDFVIERGDELVAIEVKGTSRPTHADAAALRLFADEYGVNLRGGLLLHDGTETFWATERVLAVPWWKVL